MTFCASQLSACAFISYHLVAQRSLLQGLWLTHATPSSSQRHHPHKRAVIRLRRVSPQFSPLCSPHMPRRNPKYLYLPSTKFHSWSIWVSVLVIAQKSPKEYASCDNGKTYPGYTENQILLRRLLHWFSGFSGVLGGFPILIYVFQHKFCKGFCSIDFL